MTQTEHNTEHDAERYRPEVIEPGWRDRWETSQLYRSQVDWDRPKHYAVTMLPYPSGDLHIGHWFAMTPSDARARFMRMRGYNVLFPMGFDAFGLPAENAANKNNIHPAKWTYANIERMHDQMKSMGAMFDWEREIVACDPSYYRWTEWFFSLFYRNDLAYRGEALVNWSEALQTVLANEQVIDGRDERLGQPVVQKLMTQWFFRYRAYADEMLSFDRLDWPDPIRIMQTNWIGRSEGARITFRAESGDDIVVFTTRPDTLWGATFMVLAPEHPLVDAITSDEQRATVDAYREQAAGATEIERLSEDRERTGVFTGGYAVNPATGQRIPIWMADYVLGSYGTGAIMAVPYGDQRDFDFARQYDLSIVPVVQPDGDGVVNPDTMTEAYSGPGVLVNSGPIDGTVHNGEKGRKSPAIAAAIDYLEAEGVGSESVNYRLRDWLISRQRYWGSPIPVIYQQDGSIELVDDEHLPVQLPESVEFDPSGRSPLTTYEPFYQTEDSQGRPARRETDTLDTFMCSSWYFLRYMSPGYQDAPFDPEEAAYWLPIDTYTGGTEHATMHLLYARWFYKAIRDSGVFDDTQRIAQAHGRDTDGMFDEPMLLLRNQGQVLGFERQGDWIVATGQWDGNRLKATEVRVAQSSDRVAQGDGIVVGELMRRNENTLYVGPEMQIVELTADAVVDIPHILGSNNVNQLSHHLEIQRMSKSKGNVVNPDELVERYGSDTVRAYLMFNFDWQKGGPWNESNIKGPAGWLSDVWDVVVNSQPAAQGDAAAERDVERKAHQAIRMVTRGLEDFSFNTAVAEQMKLKNFVRDAMKSDGLGRDSYEQVVSIILRLMAPIAPHLAEELWSRMGWEYSVHLQPWPEYNAEKAREDEIELVVMINGKPRESIAVSADISNDDAESRALASSAAISALDGGTPRRVIVIPRREGQQDVKVNIVV